MKSKVVLVAFLLMLYIPLMILSPSYTAPSIADESNFTLSSGENWLSDWTYRRNHTVNGSSGAGTKYPIKLETYYSGLFSLTYNISWADKAHQGVTTDGTFVYTTNSTMISKYQKDGTFVDSKDTTADRTYSGIGDLCYYDGYLYVIDHDGGHPAQQKAMKYLASDLSYSTSYSLNAYYSENSGSANIAYGNDSFWTLSDWTAPDTFFEAHRYNTGWTYQENWTVEAFSMSGNYRYQGFDWIDENYFITVSHEGTTPEKVDFYYFNGTTFSQHTQLDRPEWTGEDSSTYEACQGLAVEVDGDTTYVWFASRNNTAETQAGEVARYVLSTDSENHQIYLERNCQTDFGDIRFTDDDGNTELDYWMEEYDSGIYATFWINVTDDLDSDVVIYVYYGTSGSSSTTSDGVSTFLFYEDWESESIRASYWDILDTAGSVSWSATDAAHGTMLRLQGNAGSNRYTFSSDDSWSASVSFRMRSKIEKTSESFQITQIGFQGGDARLQVKSSAGTNNVYIVDDDNNPNHLAHNYWDNYYVYEVARNGTYARFWVDNEFIDEKDNAPDANSHVLNFYCRDSEYDVYNDWIIVRKYIHDEPAHHTWGAEEIYSPPEWTQISSITLLFQSPISLWSLNVIMVFAGLIMMPVSTLYLVHGGRKGLSNDKVFYTLLMFFMGFALFLGGIMP